MKKGKIIISIILLAVIVITTLNISFTSLSTVATAIIENKTVYEEADDYQGLIINANKLVADSTDIETMKENTNYLQECIDKASRSGGGKVKIPSGIYYFIPQNSNGRKNSDYVIKARNNVIIEGAGTEDDRCTILKPYGKAGEFTETIAGGIDMFYYNEYADSNFQNKTYLENADFRNFIIDGEKTEIKGAYNSSGKGFMLNLVKNCDYENIIVKNTSATGIGMDCPINCTIQNSTAIGCGKDAAITDNGAAGFGISHGFDENESIIIRNCTSIGNKKYGFFVVNMSVYFTDNREIYPNQDNQGIVISNCMAEENMYDFGGISAYDVTLEHCLSNSMTPSNIAAFRFDDDSQDIHIINCTSNQRFNDVTDYNAYYYEPVYWALNNGITNGVSKNEFAPNKPISVGEAARLIWRAKERYMALYIPQEEFSAECTRAYFIHLLSIFSGSPYVEYESPFIDVKGKLCEPDINWACSLGIVAGTSSNTFSPDRLCTRAEAITFLYRYAHANTDYSITYNLDGGESPKTNYTGYTAGSDEFQLTNPVKKGYTFIGWTGSNYPQFTNQECYIPQMDVKINKTDVGNKTFTANWEPNYYNLRFDSNGGTGTMDEQLFIYDDVPQKLLVNRFTRYGYVFKGWNTKADGTGIAFRDQQVVKNLTTKPNGIVTLYAQWEAKEAKYKVEHYKQNVNGSWPIMPTETETFTAPVGTEVTPSTKTYSGYSIPMEQTVTVNPYGTTVVRYYYKKINNRIKIPISKELKMF